jgi:hypothetical protein
LSADPQYDPNFDAGSAATRPRLEKARMGGVRMRVLVALAALAVLAAACGSDSNDAGADGATATGATAAGGGDGLRLG